MDYARDPNSLAPCQSYEASDDRFEANIGANQVPIRSNPDYEDSWIDQDADYSAFRRRFITGINMADVDTVILPPSWTGQDLASQDIPERGQE